MLSYASRIQSGLSLCDASHHAGPELSAYINPTTNTTLTQNVTPGFLRSVINLGLPLDSRRRTPSIEKPVHPMVAPRPGSAAHRRSETIFLDEFRWSPLRQPCHWEGP